MFLNTRSQHASHVARAAAAAFCIAALASSGVSLAQTTTMSGFQIADNQPININAEKMEVDDSQKLITFTGDVVAVQGENTVKSSRMVVRYKGGSTGLTSGQGDIDRIDLYNNVQLQSKAQSATADKGYFDMTTQHFVLTGDRVVLKEGANVFTGCKLTVNMVTSEANLDACGGRVQIQLDPKSRPGN
ncbi:LptA/OstA family protein [Martelella mediterranea]|uniref:Lipopolysaccharide export system protein LptA n=1 Tax=Martelella mediterranea TaxID=293089 RepID=A0A4R3NY40_9HYPH|nr:LptA/OstA family protein [Martelella mediterranea]TCT43024.1 lipopolysaccharide export system protein LptA [Martelella mediterranea]